MNPAARRKDIFKESVGGEVILYDKANHRAHCLNQSVAVVWDYSDGERSVDDLARLLEEKLSIPHDHNIVFLAIEQLNAAGLMISVAQSEIPPSRREATRRLALGGVSATLIPFMASVLAPTPAMASSPASGYTSATVQQDLAAIENDISSDLSAFLKNSTAQQDLNSALNAVNQGLVQTAQGNNGAAQTDFQTAESDFNGVLKALGLPPL